jgi:pectinesterase
MQRVIITKVVCLFLVLTNVVFSQTANPDQYKYEYTVAQDGSGDYTTVQEAINVMRVFTLKPITLHIKNGVYKEKIELFENKTDVRFVGESAGKTIITFDDYSGKGKLNTFNSYTAKISGNRFVAENITFENSAGRVGQAVALYVDADEAVFENCRFLGNQDTVFLGGERSRQYFVNCFIEGTTDFIFGPATAVFQNCEILCKSDSYITAPNTPKEKEFGFVFLDCKVKVSAEVTKEYLGRPWRAWGNSVFIRCELPQKIAPEGWDNWSNVENEKTAYFAEYQSKGLGSNPEGRVKWSYQLTKKESKKYTLKNILSPETKIGTEWYRK